MKLEVGSVIYIIDSGKRTVLPARVNEQLVSRTLQGEKITHNVEFPNGKTTTLEAHDIAFFSSLDKVGAYLLERAKEMIKLSVENAEKIAEEKFGNNSTDNLADMPATPEDVTEHTATTQDREMKVTLESGQRVNLIVPESF